MSHHLAQVNVARLRAPIDDPMLADFNAQLDPVNALADAAPGFVWRLQTEDGNATSVVAFEWDAADSVGVIVNMSVWRDVESLQAFTYSNEHAAVMRRRREWFHPMTEAYLACWWIPIGETPSTQEAEERVRHLREHGPTEYAFNLKRVFSPPAERSG